MSLRPDDRSSRGRSSSKTRERSRSRSNVRTRKSPPSPPEIVKSPRQSSASVASTPSMPGAYDDGRSGKEYRERARSSTYDSRPLTTTASDRPEYVRQSSQPQQRYSVPSQQSYYPSTSQSPQSYSSQAYRTSSSMTYPSDGDKFMSDNYWKDFPPHERPGYVASSSYRQSSNIDDHHLAYGDDGRSNGRTSSYSGQYDSRPMQSSYQSQSSTYPTGQYGYNQYTSSSESRPSQYSYQDHRYSNAPQGQYAPPQGQYQQPREHRESVSKPQRPSIETHSSSSNRLSTSMGLLTVGGESAHAGGSGGLPPPSPLLEAYRGTYQSISPMPLAIRPKDNDAELAELEPLSPQLSRISTTSSKPNDSAVAEVKPKKRVRLYDPEKDAEKLAKALKHKDRIDAPAICDVLPSLTHDQVMYLRKEYKKLVRVGGKGVNLPVHIYKFATGNFMKVSYVTALGRWESEGYWANFFWQSHGSRHELLIESLMGRTNAEIKNIEEEFKDKKYGDSLVECMERELKMDKFRTAVLMVLDQRRQEEQEIYRPDEAERDVEILHRALTAKQGGESAMLEIIILRSDGHLREVLKIYEQKFGENFARAALKKSNNLVGEIIAHILNGVINKPTRDAILLHHAIADIAAKNKADELRYELLISRLVRLHWDKPHLARVKMDYHSKYGVRLEDAIEEALRGDFCEFMIELCNVRATASASGTGV